ncbi:sodium:solute symporter family protein, partial [Desulforhopalus vacuolatus]
YMLYAIMISAAAIALSRGGGISGIISALPVKSEHLNIFAMGTSRTLLDLAAMVAGVLSTQIYLQAIFSAKTVREARNGALLSAAVIPPIGLLGIIIGLYLKGAYPELAANSAEALPFFFKIAFPEPIAALCAAGLLLVVLGTGSGLILGVSTNIYVDVILKSRNQVTGSLRGVRICALTVLLSSAGIVLLGSRSAILQWSYLSMGLRGSAVFAGLCIAVFLRKIAGTPLVRMLLYLLPVIYLLLAVPTTGQ